MLEHHNSLQVEHVNMPLEINTLTLEYIPVITYSLANNWSSVSAHTYQETEE